jgi:hypothetical protein
MLDRNQRTRFSPAQLCYALCQSSAGLIAARAAARTLRHLGWQRDFFLPFDALSLDHKAVAGLMRLWSRIHWSAGDGMMPPEQLLAVYRLGVTWPGDGDTVELGAWVGLTTCYLAMACDVRGTGKVHAVDTFQGAKEAGTTYRSVQTYAGSTLSAFDERIARAGLDHRVERIISLTSDAAGRYRGAPIRLLLIDADHSYEGVRQDFNLWSRHVACGGLIVFHDYLMSDVARFVDQEVRVDPCYAASPGHVVPNVFAVTKLREEPARR